MFWLKLHVSVNISVNSRWICTKPSRSRVNFSRWLEWGVTTHVLTKKSTFWSISQWILDETTTNHYKPWHGLLQMMTWIITNHYKSPQVYHDMNHHKSQITTNHHKPWHKPPWTMTKTSTKHDMNHYKSPQTMTWTIMMIQKELCIKPYGFLVFCFHIVKALMPILALLPMLCICENPEWDRSHGRVCPL